jgi:hypothetical protein
MHGNVSHRSWRSRQCCARVIYTTNSIESLNYQLRKIIKNRGHFPNDHAVIKLLWLAICSIEDKRARDRAKEAGLGRGAKRKAEGHLVEGQTTTSWKQALANSPSSTPTESTPTYDQDHLAYTEDLTVTGSSLSASTVRRWLAADAIKPWQHRSWIFPRDPDFAVKAGRVLDLYAHTFDGESLGADEYVISADEKPGVQARERIHPSRPPQPGRHLVLVESEYRRHGTLAYLAAYDVRHAQVIGHCAPSTGIKPFTGLVTKVMTREPYVSARRVFWIVDNGPSHRGRTAAARLTAAFPNAIKIHTPVHASWLNQIEIYFSVVQRKLLTPANVAGLEPLAEQITAFEARYNQAAQPFDWRFNRNDLDGLLDRIAACPRRTNRSEDCRLNGGTG